MQLLNQGIQLQQVTPPTVEVVGQMLGVITQIQTKVTAARSTKWFSTGTDRNNALQALTTSLTSEQTQLQAQQTQLRTTAAAAVNAAGPHPGLGQGPHQMTNTGAQQGASGSYFDRAPGTNTLNGVFKPESQEAGARTGRGKRGEAAVREVMGDTLDHHLGLGVVPPTRLSAIDSAAHPAGATQAIPGSGDSLQVGSYQQAVANPAGDLTSYMEQRNATQAFDPDSLQRIAILDMISLNKDRHGANVMHDAAGGLHAIDQGEMAPTAMGYNGRFRDNNNASGWAWADLPESEQGWSAANRQTIAAMDPDATVDLLAQQARTTSAQVSSVTGQPAADTHLSESQIAMMKYGARTLKLCAEAGLTPSQTETIYTKRASDRDARQIGGAVQRTAKTAGGGEFADFINKTFFQDDLAAQTAQMTHTAPPAPVFAYQAPACEEEWSIAMAKGLNRVATANPAQLPAIHQALDSLLLPVQAGAAQQPVTPNDTAATASRLWAHIETGKTAVGTAGLDEKEVLGQIWTSGTPQRRQRIIQVLDVQGDQLRMSHLGYILEAVDPQHRMNLPSQLVIWYQDHTARSGDFIDWLVAHAPAAGDTTDYRDAQRRADVEVHVNAGQLAQVPAPGAAQAPMTTSGGDGWAVVLSAGQFYSQPKSPASAQVKTQHSSFMDGLPVDAAAMMRVNGGTLQFLRNHSGHYTPTTANMVRMILTFLSRGVPMADVTVRDDRLEILRQNRAATPKTEFAAMEYLGIARDQTR